MDSQNNYSEILLNKLVNFNPNIDNEHDIGKYVDILEKFNVVPDARHAKIILEKSLDQLSFLIVETGVSENDIMIAIEYYTTLGKLNQKQMQILGEYFESLSYSNEQKFKINNLIQKENNKEMQQFLHMWICDHFIPC